MLEISPVLSGKFDSPDYAPSVSNINPPPANDDDTQSAQSVSSTQEIDSRRYTQWDRSASQVGDATMSFGDFLDMINPLQHIPVVSSIYREITGENINPVSRIVGDIMYGAALGGVTAAISGASAIGNSVMEASTGKDATGNVVAALFGPDEPSSPATQVASAAAPAAPSPAQTTPSNRTANIALSAATNPVAAAAAVAPTPPIAQAATKFASMTTVPATLPPNNTLPNADTQTQALLAAKSFPLDPKKLPYGGVMDTSAFQGSNMALMAATAAPGGVQMNHTIYPGRLTTGVKPSSVVVPSAPAANASPAIPATNPVQTASFPNTPLPPELMQDIASLRAINQYKSTASQTVPNGSNVNTVN